MDPDRLFGRRLTEARRDAHLSQRAVAAELGVSVRTLQNYEAGRFVPYRHLDTLSALLGRSRAWLLYGNETRVVDELTAALRRQRLELHEHARRQREHARRQHELLEEIAARIARPATDPPRP